MLFVDISSLNKSFLKAKALLLRGLSTDMVYKEYECPPASLKHPSREVITGVPENIDSIIGIPKPS